MAFPQQPKRRPGHGIAYWIALALVLHAEAFLVLGLAGYFWTPRNADLAGLTDGKGGHESIEIGAVDDETARKILAELEREQEKAKEEQVKKEQESPRPPGQVVDLAKPREEKRPEDARFASEYDTSVEKETKKYGKFDQRSRQGDVQGQAAQSRPAMPATPPSPPSQPSPPGMLAMRPPGPKGRPSPPGLQGQTAPVPPGVPGEDIELPPDPSGELSPKGTGVAAAPAPPPGGAAGGAPRPPAAPPSLPPLQPSDQQIARAIGSGSQDHLKNIDDGEETALNAKKWKFASFFNRVKQQVRDHWKPADEYRRRDPTGAIYGHKDRYTLLRVQLKADGTLASVALELPSGVEFLDDEAIEAFKQAQPFPNPPRQLVDGGSGLIDFRFGFFFELSGAPRMKIFRYNSM